MECYRILILLTYLSLHHQKGATSPNEIKSTRMCIKDDHYICQGDLDLTGINPHSVGFSGLVYGELDPICVINLQNGYMDDRKKCYGTSNSNDRMLHFVLNKTIAGDAVHTELVANFLFKNGDRSPEESKIVKWVTKEPEVLQYQVQVNGVTLSKEQECNIEVSKELEAVYKCDTDSFQQECKLIISDETDKQVGVISEQNKPFDMDIPISMKGSTFTFKLQVCQHEHFITRCTVNIEKQYIIANDLLPVFIVVVVILAVSVLTNFLLWVICMKQRKRNKKEEINSLSSADSSKQPLNEKGNIV